MASILRNNNYIVNNHKACSAVGNNKHHVFPAIFLSRPGAPWLTEVEVTWRTLIKMRQDHFLAPEYFFSAKASFHVLFMIRAPEANLCE